MYEIFKNGGPVMVPLLFCSILVLTVIIERMIFWIKIKWLRDQNTLDDVLSLCQKRDWDAVREKTLGCRDYIVGIIVTGILHRKFSLAKAMEAASADAVQKMRRYMTVLDTMITVAPLLGIFGTVLGIIQSFKALGMAGIGQPQAVTAGVSQALITTAFGLAIAILAVIPYNYFNSRIRRAVVDIEKYATSLEIVYEKQSRNVSAINLGKG